MKVSIEESRCGQQQQQLRDGSSDMKAFSEDWNLSQFWYDEKTSETLAKLCIEGANSAGKIACLSAPSAYVAIKKHFPEAQGTYLLHVRF